MSLSSVIVALGDHRQRHVVAPVRPADGAAIIQLIDAVVGAADVERIGQHDRRPPDSRTSLIQCVPVISPLPLKANDSGRDLVIPGVGVGQNRRRAGADVAALDFCHMRDRDAGDIGDCRPAARPAKNPK